MSRPVVDGSANALVLPVYAPVIRRSRRKRNPWDEFAFAFTCLPYLIPLSELR